MGVACLFKNKRNREEDGWWNSWGFRRSIFSLPVRRGLAALRGGGTCRLRPGGCPPLRNAVFHPFAFWGLVLCFRLLRSFSAASFRWFAALACVRVGGAPLAASKPPFFHMLRECAFPLFAVPYFLLRPCLFLFFLRISGGVCCPGVASFACSKGPAGGFPFFLAPMDSLYFGSGVGRRAANSPFGAAVPSGRFAKRARMAFCERYENIIAQISSSFRPKNVAGVF